MTKLTHRFLSVLLVLTLALSLAVPVLAAEPVTGVSLDKTEVVLAPGESVALKAAVIPAGADNKKVTWKSNKTSVVEVEDGVITAKAAGTADVTVTTADGGYTAVCKVTVEDNYATEVSIRPAGPETLPVGRTRQLTAQVFFAHDPAGSQAVTWSSGDASVASVDPQGLVTAVSPGKTDIMAMSKADGRGGTPVHAFYTVTVTDGQSGDNTGDTLYLDRTKETRQGGLYQTVTLSAPAALVLRGETDVTGEYTLSWSWTNGTGKEISKTQTASVPLPSGEDVTVTCTVTAVSKTDSTREPLTARCVFTVRVLPGTVVEASLPLGAGATRLDRLMNGAKTLSVVDQLLRGGGTQLTPAVPGLASVVFFPEEAAGDAGALNVAGDVYYLLAEDAQTKLAEVVFTPLATGTYIIPFVAYGTETYYGQLEVTVTGQPTPAVPEETVIPCDSSGVPFFGSDFFSSAESDPVAALTFGKPSAGQLLRNMAYGSGAADNGAKYYTDSARDGSYHVSTLTYLPPAGFSGKVSIPVVKTTRSGQRIEGSLVLNVKSKTASDHFSDVIPATTGQWSSNAVDFAYDNKLISGVGDGLFAPDAVMTRGMLVTVLYRAAGSPAVSGTSRFRDLETDGYYYNAVRWANAKGVVSGATATTFRPDAPVTREQIAAILYRYATLMGRAGTTGTGSLTRYEDRGLVSGYAVQGMTWAVGRGIITGTGAATLSPGASATRAQVVVMLHRYLAV